MMNSIIYILKILKYLLFYNEYLANKIQKYYYY